MDDTDMRSPFKSPPGNGMHQFDSPASSSVRCGGQRESWSSGNVSDENEPPPGMLANSSSSNVEELRRVNPFEKDVLASLQNSFWSPSIMEIKQTPPQKSWAIDQLSHLFPKDIENSPSTHQNSFPVDEQTEAKAQADIAEYFNRSQIAPTPSPMKGKMSEAAHCIQVTKVSRTTSLSYRSISTQSPIGRGGVGNTGLTSGLSIKKKKGKHAIEKWTQTAMSFPVNLPPDIEAVLSQYMSQDGEMCGPSNEAVTYCSQQSETSEHADFGDNDSGKNSSSLNNSIRRRLELSFGDEPEGEDSNSLPASFSSPIVDPFRRNHLLSTPPNPAAVAAVEINTTTSEIEMQLLRCEFTPEARGCLQFATTPGITPITDEPDERRSENACSTPKRVTGRWALKEDPILPTRESEGAGSTTGISRVTSSSDEAHNELRINLRRSRSSLNSETAGRKLSAATSFDDSQYLMDDSSPPAKLFRRNSDKASS